MASKRDEATGQSEKLSFDEALQDAIKKLPPLGPEVPEKIKIEEIIVQRGDLTGRRFLSVRISR